MVTMAVIDMTKEALFPVKKMWCDSGIPRRFKVLLYAHTMGAPVPVVASNGGVKPAVTNGVTVMFPRNRPSAKRDSCRSSGPGGQIAFDGSHC